ncbi:N-acetylneuraminate epimerase [Lonepinella sp. BR2271]|uniref:N-acetylneuraminate epimerase n=1 Tax=Lonepinella sp. BR2271 TaxID=3434550 RepID=UPI003F6DE9D8
MKFTKSLLAVSVLGLTAFAAQAAQYPDLPVGIKSGAGALIGDTVYVGLGSGGDKFYSLNLKEKGAQWQELAAFPGGSRNQPVAAGIDGKLYVFGGFQNNDVADNQVINDAYSYDPASNTWTKLDTRSPRAAVGATGVTNNGKVYFVGGINQEIWNGLFQDVKKASAGLDKEKDKEKIGAATKPIFDAYFNLRAQDFFFSSEIVSYEPATNTWRNEGYFPYSGRAGASVGINNGKLLVVNGEIKAGLRTDGTAQGTIAKDGVKDWKKLGNLPAPKGYEQQDGIAGGMGGYTNGHFIVTGGANFPGARANYAKGINDAHRTGGLKKTYHSDFYALDAKHGTWKIIGNYPHNIAYGVALPYDNKVLFVGGETDGGKALTEVRTVSYDGKKLVVEE